MFGRRASESLKGGGGFGVPPHGWSPRRTVPPGLSGISGVRPPPWAGRRHRRGWAPDRGGRTPGSWAARLAVSRRRRPNRSMASKVNRRTAAAEDFFLLARRYHRNLL